MDLDSRSLPSIDPARVVVDLSRAPAPRIRVQNSASASPWAVVELKLPGGAQDPIVLRPHAAAQPLTTSGDGRSTFIVLRDALSAGQPPRLRYTLDGRRVEHPLALTNGAAGPARSRR